MYLIYEGGEVLNFRILRSKFQVFRFYIHFVGWDRFYVGIEIVIRIISGKGTKLSIINYEYSF